MDADHSHTPSSTSIADYYDVLGCSPHSDADQIHTEYRQRARLCHPDKTTNAKTTEEHNWTMVREAYEVLGNPQTKAQYDRWRAARLPMSFDQWLKTAQSQSMHWSFDYQRALAFKNDAPKQPAVSDKRRWWEPSAIGSDTQNAFIQTHGSSRDVYDLFRNYEI
ncbi:DnaJ sub C member 12 [Coemansia spiralis]|uniref:DnaJ sub C member 12 n=2 Tax=Coemansia TaxID=4863 RepID=A0A9W8G5R3_9FUNG|nr:DnaJ domain-containing protein [Coemansia spiralis]KAJ1988108.1 DnaJ sub C member 12 [Coemansia umbellata]KAJ2623906.1 DnaJ sub C member 12 [Coemansia sp. RSA 1358]KAJ2679306.1 DnaJ sub C member 12 [Coemansia spiralis]